MRFLLGRWQCESRKFVAMTGLDVVAAGTASSGWEDDDKKEGRPYCRERPYCDKVWNREVNRCRKAQGFTGPGTAERCTYGGYCRSAKF